MIEDFMHRTNITVHIAEQMALHHSQSLLQPDMLCSAIGLPELEPLEQPEHESQFDQVAEAAEAANLIDLLNDKQSEVIDSVLLDLRAIQNSEGLKCRAYFLDGPGGSVLQHPYCMV